MHDAVTVNRGFQLLNSFHFNHQIKCVTQQTSEAVAVHYAIGSDHVTSLCPFKPHDSQKKYLTSQAIQQLLYIKKYRLYVAFCLDLTLRVFSEHFEVLQTVHVTATILCLAFNDVLSELYTGGVGCINTWQLRHQLHNPLVAGKQFTCSVGQQQWVVSLDYDGCSERLVAVCQDSIHIINAQSHKQCGTFSNGHKASITSAVLYTQLDYVISAAKDGSIKVWNCILHNEVQTFTGHTKAVTGLKVHPMAPCIISCSLDGTVRMWHLENMTECYRLDCGDELLGMSTDFPLGNKAVCFSNHSVRAWAVHQLETHFASVNSNVVSMVRVDGNEGPQPARILAMAEDGGVRLLSPATGYVVSILFPMFSSQIMHEVVYSLRDNLLFVLLRTREVLVCATHTNPCSVKELWVPQQKDSITSLALCTITAEDGTLKSVVFAGQECGHISLLYGEGLSMLYPCPAHAGHVTKLASLSSPVDSNSVHPALVSHGSDNMLNIWGLEVEKGSTGLKLQMSINMELCPQHIGLLHSTLCVALADNRVVMLNIPADRLPTTPHGLMFSSLPTMTHQAEDDHTDSITSLAYCSFLKLFATTGRDGCVKIWSSENELVSEIHFGATLTSACFANPKGDLLVGFQKHICNVYREDYLTHMYLKLGRKYQCRDCIEDPIPFDPTLEFWYDTERVPSLPAQQEQRQRLQKQPSPDLSHNEKEGNTNGATMEVAVGRNCHGAKENLQASSMVNKSLARGLSQKYFASLHHQESTGNIHHQASMQAIPENFSETITKDCSSSQIELSSHNPSSAAEFGWQEQVSMLPKSGILSSTSLSHMTPHPLKPPLAEVMPLHSASDKLPIAPDGLIPNSVLRAQIGYVPTEVVFPTQRSKPKEKTFPALPKVAAERENNEILKEESSSIETLKFRREGDEERTCVSEFLKLESESPPKKQAASEQHLLSTETDNPLPSTPKESPQITGTQNAHKKTSTPRDTQPNVAASGAEPPMQRETEVYMRTSQSQQRRRLSTSNSRTLPKLSTSYSSRRGASIHSVDLQLLPSHDNISAPATGIPIQKSKSSSIGEHPLGSGLDGATSTTLHTLELSGTALLLQRIVSKPWFTRKVTPPSVKLVFEALLFLLKTSQLPSFAEVCSSMMELKNASLLTNEQQLAVHRQLLSRMKSKAHSLKVTILRVLEQLGMGGEKVIVIILPLLVDPDLEIRFAAFRTLKQLTGVVTRSQLHQLLVELGLLWHTAVDEDEIMEELAARVRNGVTSLPHSEDMTKSIVKHNGQQRKADEASNGSSIPKLPGIPLKCTHHTSKANGFQKPSSSPAKIGEETLQYRSNKLCLTPANTPEQGSTETASRAALAAKTGLKVPVGMIVTYPYKNYDVQITAAVQTHAQHAGTSKDTATVHSHTHTHTSSKSKLHQLIVQHPTTFSQTKPAIKLMLNAYGHSEASPAVDEYAWSEVFPVLKAARNRRSHSLPSKQLMPRLPKLSPTSTIHRSEDLHENKVVKLPKIGT